MKRCFAFALLVVAMALSRTAHAILLDAGAPDGPVPVYSISGSSVQQTVTITPSGVVQSTITPPTPPSLAVGASLPTVSTPAASTPAASTPVGPLILGSPPRFLWAPNVVTMVWGAGGSLDATHAQWATDITSMHLGLLTSVDFMAPFGEYPGPPPNAGTINAFNASVQGPTYVTLANHNVLVSEPNDIRNEIEHQVAIGALPAPSSVPGGQLLYVIFLPPTVRFPNSCMGLFGYHQWDSTLGAAYSVIPFCNGTYPDGTRAVVSDESGTEYAAAHELMEAMTDSDPGLGWWNPQPTLEGRGDEIGDLCGGAGVVKMSIFSNQGPYTVPLFFSNRAYNAWPSDAAQPVTHFHGCVLYPAGCTVCWPCPGGCMMGSNYPTCNPGCLGGSCVNGCMTVGNYCLQTNPCTAATNCQTISDDCGNPVACPCITAPPPNVPASSRWSVAFLALSLGGLGAIAAVRMRRRAA
jgi:hypothetical protein